MNRLVLFVALCLAAGGCKEQKKMPEQQTTQIQQLTDQYAEIALTTDVTKLTENEKKMIPILMKAADLI